jgi:hypothetical protein
MTLPTVVRINAATPRFFTRVTAPVPTRKMLPDTLKPWGNAPDWRGAGSIAGHVQIGSLPVSKRVRCYDRKTGKLVAETWSDAGTGAYTFARLNPLRLYTVLAIDDANQYNAVAADEITPG